jgi:hypothetical protein
LARADLAGQTPSGDARLAANYAIEPGAAGREQTSTRSGGAGAVQTRRCRADPQARWTRASCREPSSLHLHHLTVGPQGECARNDRDAPDEYRAGNRRLNDGHGLSLIPAHPTTKRLRPDHGRRVPWPPQVPSRPAANTRASGDAAAAAGFGGRNGTPWRVASRKRVREKWFGGAARAREPVYAKLRLNCCSYNSRLGV